MLSGWLGRTVQLACIFMRSGCNAFWIPQGSTEASVLPRLSVTNQTLSTPLHVQGRYIIDNNGERAKLLGVNWYGASDERWITGGLEVQHRNDIAMTIKNMGFNVVRLPYSDEMVTHNPLIDNEDLAANPDLYGLRALDVYYAVIEALTSAQLAVVINNHITQATWCCGIDLCDGTWENIMFPFCRVIQSEVDWINHWVHVMTPLQNNSLVIGADLRNEPRSIYLPWEQWASAAERAGNRLLSMNPDWLMIVEGVHSANDLSGVAGRSVQFDVPHKLVYSAHVYKWGGWGEGTMHGDQTYDDFRANMIRDWAYLVINQQAAVWIGEFGTVNDNTALQDRNYWNNMVQLLRELDLDFAYWAINTYKPHNHETEPYSILKDDWITPVSDFRISDLQSLMPVSP